ncbi:MAG: DUF1566 domain-containing protein [Candidatus Contendobacter sp.]|nr:DUF1566 domain-containing protein [Candidatus Contendobacter sp.]
MFQVMKTSSFPSSRHGLAPVKPRSRCVQAALAARWLLLCAGSGWLVSSPALAQEAPDAAGASEQEAVAVGPATINDVLAGKTFGVLVNGKWTLKTGVIPARTNVVGADGAVLFPIPNGFYTGNKTARARDVDLVVGNIRRGVNLFGVIGTAPLATGTAAPAQVLSGVTFSNAAASGQIGTMPNRGTQTITPGVAAKLIPLGYHNGLGSVAGDADLAAGNIKTGVAIFGVTGSYTGGGSATFSAPFPVAKTGDPNEDSGVDWPNPRFAAKTNGTVTDNLTGLVWLKNANCEDTVGGIIKIGGRLSWNKAMTWAVNLASGKCGLSDGSAAGQWRLPNIKELSSLVDARFSNPSVPNTVGTGQWAEGQPFTAVKAEHYWSSTTYAADSSGAWLVYLISGDVYWDDKSYGFFVWPVRGGL